MHHFAWVHLDSARKSDPFLTHKIEAMWLAFFVLFIALCPGVIFTAPSLGKKVGSKLSIAVIHAIIFVIVINLLYVSIDGFQGVMRAMPTNVRSFFGWTINGMPPEDPLTTVNNRKVNIQDYEENVAEERRLLSAAEEAAAALDPPGSRNREKCMSVQNTSCPSADGQLRLFGSDDCTKLGGAYNANGECDGYSSVCAKILNRLRPVGNQDASCIAARTALASAPSTGATLSSLMGLANAPMVRQCPRNAYYNMQRRSCVSCTSAPLAMPEPAYSSTVASIKSQCPVNSRAWIKVNSRPIPVNYNPDIITPVTPVGEPAVPSTIPGAIPAIASALGMGSYGIPQSYTPPSQVFRYGEPN